MKNDWSEHDKKIAASDLPLKKIAEMLGRSVDAVRQERHKIREENGEAQKRDEQTPGESYEEGNDFINIICASKRIMSQDEIIKQFKIDMDVWEVDRFKVKTSEGYRKDRSVEWHVHEGKVDGDVSDSGNMLVVPMYHVELRLIKKKNVFDTKLAIEQLISDAKKYHCVYPKPQHDKSKTPLLYEIDIPDIHFGRLSWDNETGENYDVALAENAVWSVIEKLLTRLSSNPAKILLPIGNDFYNVDNDAGTTTKGTPQREDCRWQRSFRRGRELCVKMIDLCQSIAPVDVLIIPGNHDVQRSFYLGDALSCWYHENKYVSIDNEPISRKYYQFGKGLIGFTHGSELKLEKLPLIMAMEQPGLWAKTKYREWHTGHRHIKNDTIYAANEVGGVVVRILRALTATDAWTFNGGLIGSKRSSESFLWDENEGIVAQYTATP